MFLKMAAMTPAPATSKPPLSGHLSCKSRRVGGSQGNILWLGRRSGTGWLQPLCPVLGHLLENPSVSPPVLSQVALWWGRMGGI